jgi:hypothetical protein
LLAGAWLRFASSYMVQGAFLEMCLSGVIRRRIILT